MPALSAGTYRLEVRTQFTGGGDRFLKTPRAAVFDRLLTVAAPPAP
ncbi:MAG: DUF4469 domain-containing protein [Treponema sp.]|nr:DUF4469 domain-containing protein [Treponema sp.]